MSTEEIIKPNYVETVLHGLAPCHAPTKSYRDVVYGLKSALIFANNLPHGAALTGQLCDVANLLWDYENSRLQSDIIIDNTSKEPDQPDWKEKAETEIYDLIKMHDCDSFQSNTTKIIQWIEDNKHIIK